MKPPRISLCQAELMAVQKDDRISVPYVLLYYLPVSCNSEMKMLYASAKELMKNKAGVQRIIDIDSADDLEDIPDKLRE